MVSVTHRLETLFRVDIVLRKHVEARHKETRGRVRIANTEVLRPRRTGCEQVLQRINVLVVLVNQDMGIVALLPVGLYLLNENFATGTVDRFHRRLVAKPGHALCQTAWLR